MTEEQPRFQTGATVDETLRVGHLVDTWYTLPVPKTTSGKLDGRNRGKSGKSGTGKSGGKSREVGREVGDRLLLLGPESNWAI